jgi:peptidoglycan biosynthesis protein MviN/MurJ (putative lipid II flippase)
MLIIKTIKCSLTVILTCITLLGAPALRWVLSLYSPSWTDHEATKIKNTNFHWVWWYMPVIPEFGRLRQ